MTTIAPLPRFKRNLEEQLKVFEKEGKLQEAQRLKQQRTEYDIEMLREMGYTTASNHPRHMDVWSVKESLLTPSWLLPEDFLIKDRWKSHDHGTDQGHV